MASFIADHVLEQIRQSNDIVDLIGSYFPLKRAGANFRALCPFHKEKTPSFNVNAQKQIWHCFGCGAGGDVFSFVMKYENLDFRSAVRRLAERAGVRLEFDEATRDSDQSARDQKELLLALHEQVTAFFHETLLHEKAAEPARTYLAKRSIGAETVKRWRLGYSPDSWDALIQWAVPRKFSPALLEMAGLALRRERGDGFYDRFRGRLMFPICDEQGRVVAFSGRILTDAKDQPKYVNSPETAIFQKGRILFALDKAKRAILDEKIAIVCEGQVDTISCHEVGIANVVAPQGTALTEQHARILKRYAEEVILMFDADAAGQNAVVRSADPLWEAGLSIRVIVLPEGHDPDSLVKSGGIDKLKDLVTKAPSFFVYLLERLSHQYDPKSDRGRQQITEQIAHWLLRQPNPLLFKVQAQEAAKRLGIVDAVVEQTVLGLKRRLPHVEAAAELKQETGDVLPAEKLLLQLMLSDDRVVEAAIERLDRVWLAHGVAGDLIGRIMDSHAHSCWHGPETLLNQALDETANRLLSELMVMPLSKLDARQAAADCLASLERRWLEGKLRDMRKHLSRPDLPKTEMVTLQQQVLDLRHRLDHIAPLSMGKNRLLSNS